MGTFRRTVEIANIGRRSRGAEVPNVLVDTGSEYSWIPAATLEGIGIKREKKDLSFLMANGQTVTRSTGFAILRIGEAFTVDEVVFGEPGDQALLGARTLEGMNMTVDPARRRLVAAGPLPAASSFSVLPQRQEPSLRKRMTENGDRGNPPRSPGMKRTL